MRLGDSRPMDSVVIPPDQETGRRCTVWDNRGKQVEYTAVALRVSVAPRNGDVQERRLVSADLWLIERLPTGAERTQSLTVRGLPHREIPFYFSAIREQALSLEILGSVIARPKPTPWRSSSRRGAGGVRPRSTGGNTRTSRSDRAIRGSASNRGRPWRWPWADSMTAPARSRPANTRSESGSATAVVERMSGPPPFGARLRRGRHQVPFGASEWQCRDSPTCYIIRSTRTGADMRIAAVLCHRRRAGASRGRRRPDRVRVAGPGNARERHGADRRALAAGAFTPPGAANASAAFKSAGVLSRHAEADAVVGLRHPRRSLAAAVRMESEAAGARQRRSRRNHSVPGARERGEGGLCRCRHRYRSRRRQRRFRGRASGEARRLRVSRDPRDDRVGEDARRRALRRAAGEVLLQLVLDGRTAGADRSAAVSRGLRRHRRRRSVVGPDAALRRARLSERLRQPRTGRRHSAEQVPDDARRGAQRVRREGRRQGRRDRESDRDVRSTSRRSPATATIGRLPDEAASRDRESDVVADHGSHRAARSCIPAATIPDRSWDGAASADPRLPASRTKA